MIIKIPKRNKTVSGIAPQIVNYHCHMVDIPPFSKAQRLYQHKSVEGFEPPIARLQLATLDHLAIHSTLYKTCATIVTQETKDVNHSRFSNSKNTEKLSHT